MRREQYLNYADRYLPSPPVYGVYERSQKFNKQLKIIRTIFSGFIKHSLHDGIIKHFYHESFKLEVQLIKQDFQTWRDGHNSFKLLSCSCFHHKFKLCHRKCFAGIVYEQKFSYLRSAQPRNSPRSCGWLNVFVLSPSTCSTKKATFSFAEDANNKQCGR